MCGITGIVSRDPISDEQSTLVAAMNALQTHRGPDGDGEIAAPHLRLAMRRLSIIDLSTGWQPLYNEDRSLALICNGEVYNFVELRRMLESKGHRFATKSDCETILHLYEEFGDDCVHHLRGMYAFALWDAKRRRVLLVRDRMGEKPLYLVERDGELIFASELRTLVHAGVIPVELDPVAIHLYFHFGYVPEPGCPLKDVRKLPAGHVLSIDVDNWKIEQRCYWRMEDAPPIEGDPATLIREELERISELIIRSDVPVGVALSGGLDSSIIAVLAQKNYPGTMQAITIGYEGTPWQDERAMARELADHLKMPIHEMQLTTRELVESFPQMIHDRDEPIADMAGMGYWQVMKKAREQNLPVMLAGQGGDELFWGYAWVRQAAEASRRKQRMQKASASAGLFEYWSPSMPPFSHGGAMRWLRSLGGVRSAVRQRAEDRANDPRWMVFYDIEPHFRDAMNRAPSMYAPDFGDRVRGADPRQQFAMDQPWPNVDVALIRLISETYLRQNGLAQSDRLSMAWSVELRLPLVDYRLAEIVVGLTKSQPSVSDTPKKWLREAVREIMPPFVTQRRKRGFSPPWRNWCRATAAAYGGQLDDGVLAAHGVFSEHGLRDARSWLSPSWMAMPQLLSDRVLTLEMWLRGMERSKGQRVARGPGSRQVQAVC